MAPDNEHGSDGHSMIVHIWKPRILLTFKHRELIGPRDLIARGLHKVTVSMYNPDARVVDFFLHVLMFVEMHLENQE